MIIALTFENYDEIQKFCHTAVDAHPDELVLIIDGMRAERPHPRHRKALCDDELSLDELSLYEAGRLHVYYHLMEAGLFDIEQIADVLDLDVTELDAKHHIWENGQIVERRDAMCKMLLKNAERDMQKEGESV